MASYSTNVKMEKQPIKSSKLIISQLSFLKDSKKGKNSFVIKYYPWTLVSEIRSIIASKNNIPPKNVRLFFKNEELISNLKMIDYGIPFQKKPEIFFEIFSYKNDYSLEIYGTVPCPPTLEKIIYQVRAGFAKGLKPKLLEDGTSGPNNQKGYANSFGSKSFREGILSGEATIREEATYLLDSFYAEKFQFDVPATTFVELCHKSFKINIEDIKIMENNKEDNKNRRDSIMRRFLYENLRGGKGENSGDIFMSTVKYNYIPKKYGTLQKFINSTGVAADYSYSLFTVEEAHKIMILDFRILNCDRNDENILLQKKTKTDKNNKDKEKVFYKLVPIDHALSFPSCLEIGDFDICWMSWKQAEVPFTQKEKDYIDNINIIDDMERLNSFIYLRPECWKYFRISNTVLKVGAKYNLTPFEIGSLLYHFDYDNKTPSKIKTIVEKTEKLTYLFKKGNRSRIFSFEGKINNSEKLEKKNLDKKEGEGIDDGGGTSGNKKRVNSFFRKDRGRRRKSLLESTTSAPKNGACGDDSNDEDDDYSNLKAGYKKKKKDKSKMSSHKSSLDDEYVFDSPYNQLYFQNFTMFLEELIKNEYPEKAKLYEENNSEFMLTIEEKNSSEFAIK